MTDAAHSFPVDEAAVAAAATATRNATRRTWLIRLGLVVAAAALLWAVWYYLFGRNHVSTDDAYVSADVAEVTPLVASSVVAVKARKACEVIAGL